MEQVPDKKIIDEPGGEFKKLYPVRSAQTRDEDFIRNSHVFWNRLCRDVFGNPKNLLDLKRQITRSGPLSVF